MFPRGLQSGVRGLGAGSRASSPEQVLDGRLVHEQPDCSWNSSHEQAPWVLVAWDVPVTPGQGARSVGMIATGTAQGARRVGGFLRTRLA